MTDFILPDIGEGIVECELLEWLVAEGDVIVEDQPVAEVMTDKATVQIPAMYSGKVLKLYYKTGEIAKVHAPLFAMQIDGADQQAAPQQAAPRQVAPRQVAPEVASAPATPESTQTAQTSKVDGDSIDFILPDIGEGIVECELVKWLVNEGDEILEDQAVVEVMTDKALVEIPAKYSGKVSKLYYAQGDIARVHTPLFAMQVKDSGNAPAAQKVQNAQQPAQVSSEPSHSAAANDLPAMGKGKALASPAVRRMARELDVDLASVKGSGDKGRVLKCDLSAPASNETKLAPVKAATVESVGGIRKEQIRGIKAVMAKQMLHAVTTVPHFTVSDEIELDNLIAVRNRLKEQFANQGVKLSFMPFFMKALSLALKQFPIINSQVNSDCTEITYFDEHNIGLAIDSKIGLLVPNLKGVQHLSLFEIAQKTNDLVELGRQGKLKTADLKGGTISISNIGVLGGTVATPVINAPESAIVALGKIQRLPRFDANDNVVAVNIMQVSWSGDHRIIDGATMVRFNNLWKSYLENPLTMLVELK
ncbi:dihydrolipoyllysine-residue acetyltransferase [Paraglaciecola sp. 25GB23A]|uniref:dihydrolipoyllysine-residue acetyltransferase n=1 Tax=Paraglaciecola sp. 25GB23A TaxID=3156068 RepID=UPI0032AF1DB2